MTREAPGAKMVQISHWKWLIPARGRRLCCLSPLTAGSSRSLHNVTYVTYVTNVPPDCPIPPGPGGAPRSAPPLLPAALTGRKIPLGISPWGFWEGSPGPRLCPRAGAERREREVLAASPPPSPRLAPGAGHCWGAAGSAPLFTALLGSFLSSPRPSPVHFSPSFLSD